MPGTYGSHALPLVLGSDRPCDSAATLCALRDRLNTLMDDYQEVVDTVVNAVPAARLFRPMGSPYVNAPAPEGNVLLPFTSVDFDNANMTNLSSNARVITAPKIGRYWINGYIQISQRAGSTIFDQETISIEGGLFNSTTPRNTCAVKTTGGGNPTTSISISDLRGAFPGDEFALRLFPTITFGTPGITILNAQFSVWWHSDFDA